MKSQSGVSSLLEWSSVASCSPKEPQKTLAGRFLRRLLFIYDHLLESGGPKWVSKEACADFLFSVSRDREGSAMMLRMSRGKAGRSGSAIGSFRKSEL